MDSQASATALAGLQAGRPAWPVVCGMMPPLDRHFSPRPETAAPNTDRALASGVPVVLTCRAEPAKGVPDGRTCGKTQLAVFAAQSLLQARQLDLLVWVAAASQASVLSGYVDAARAVMGAGLTGTAESVAARFASWLRGTSRRWLVVLDNLPGPEVLGRLWPEGPAGSVLITTTSPAAAFDGRRARVVPIGPFSTREALSYIMGRLTADTDQRAGAMDLAGELGGEPLALAQAAAVIGTSARTCLGYRDEFARRRAQLPNTNGRDLPPTAVTWTFSLEQANRLSPDGAAQLLLALAALLGSQGIPGMVFSATAVYAYLAGLPVGSAADASHRQDQAGQERAWEALLVLERTGLLALGLDPPGSGSTAWMSQASQGFVQAALPAQLRDRAARAAADALLEAWPVGEEQGWLAGALRSCAASLVRATGDLLWAGGCHRLLLRAGQSLASAGLTGPAVAYWRNIAAVSERVLGKDHPDTVTAAEELAGAYMAAGQAADAAQWFEWVLVLRVRTLGQDHVGAIAARRSLGHALVAAGQLGDAAIVLEQVAADYERVSGTDHLDTIGTLEELAAALSAAAQFADASSLYRRTAADRERIQGSRHPDTLATRQKLADTSLAAGRPRDARKQYQRVLADRERALGPDHPDTIASLSGLGAAYLAQGKMALALQQYEQAVTRSKRILSADHRSTLAARASLATVYYQVGRATDAVAVLRDTAARCERVLPHEDPLTQTVHETLRNIAG
jgi:tetratricopeptide (TPR) repeat protein